jgi:hypothetical protein
MSNNVFITGDLSIPNYANVADALDAVQGAWTNFINTADNITTVLSNAANGTRIEMESGTYTVTPSILNSNLITSTVFQGVKLINKTNITIKGVKGLTVWDGSGGLGEVFVITNCDNVTIEGVTFRGYTNHNFMALPAYNGTTNQNSYLWALVNYYACSRLTFKDCTFERSADHGLQDKGAENSSFLASSILSTNQIRIINNTFSDIGGMRTNQAGGLQTDGTAIICTDALVDGNYFVNCFRGFEPYNEGEPSGNVTFNNTQFRNNTMINIAEHFITLAGSTNGNGIVIDGNYLYREPGFLYHGTNTDNGFGGAYGIGINMNGGNRHVIRGNVIRNMASSGISIQTSQANPVQGVSVVGNFIDGATNASAAAYGMFIGDPAFGVIFPVRNAYIANNTIRNTKTYAIYGLGLADSTIENNELINPVFPGAGAAIVLQSAGGSVVSNVVVRQNQIKDTGTAEMTYGINITAGCLAIQTFDNKIENGTTGTILNGAGTGLTQYDTVAGSTNRLLRAHEVRTQIEAGSNITLATNSSGVVTITGAAGAASTNFITTAHGSAYVTNSVTAQSFIGSGTGTPILKLQTMMSADNAFAITVDTNYFGLTNTFNFTNLAVGQQMRVKSVSNGNPTWEVPQLISGVLTNTTSVQADWTGAELIHITNSLIANVVIIPTNMVAGKSLRVVAQASTQTYTLSVSNAAGTVVLYPFASTNGGSAYTVTNGQTVELDLLSLNGKIHAAMGRFQ